MVVNALSHKFMGSLAHIVKVRSSLGGKIYGLQANEIKLKTKET